MNMDAHHDEHGHHDEPPADIVVRVQAIEALLIEQGLVDPAAMDALIDTYEHKVGPHIGARLIASAWADPAFKARVLRDANAALEELDERHRQRTEFVVLENTSEVRHVIVCTLCSCYPSGVLGLPPKWYKSVAYRSRVVREPRKVLAEFGCNVDPSVEVRVWDSTSELRYMVLPERPPGTDDMTVEQLAALVTRDSMLGVADPKTPGLATASSDL